LKATNDPVAATLSSLSEVVPRIPIPLYDVDEAVDSEMFSLKSLDADGVVDVYVSLVVDCGG
jgi:hypothetical protein